MAKVTVYTKVPCPFCEQAKTLLHSLNVDFSLIDLTGDYDKIQEISQKSGLMTLPQIFVDDRCLGGYSDIQQLHEQGRLINELNS